MKYGLMIIGSEGFIGRHFARAFPDALAIVRSQLDLADPVITFPTDGFKYALIAAGIGNPRKCAYDVEHSYLCNVEGTLKLGQELLKRGVKPIFFSSDYVFDDALNIAPLNVYGKQKAELEERGSKLNALIIRLSKVYGLDRGDNTLFDEMAAKLNAGVPVRAARDQFFAPIFIGDVIRQILFHLEKKTRGVVNVVGPAYASRFVMARALAQKLGVDQNLIHEISLDELNDGIQRPKFLTLTSSFRSLTWEEGIKLVVDNYAQ